VPLSGERGGRKGRDQGGHDDGRGSSIRSAYTAESMCRTSTANQRFSKSMQRNRPKT
jgi:hypothetical protein